MIWGCFDFTRFHRFGNLCFPENQLQAAPVARVRLVTKYMPGTYIRVTDPAWITVRFSKAWMGGFYESGY
jgi:hypothetical protein